MNKLFKIYVAIMLLLIVLLLGTLVAGLVYADRHIHSQVSNVKGKVNSINTSLNTINTDLNNINAQLKKNGSSI